jgi:hypothetical protein
MAWLWMIVQERLPANEVYQLSDSAQENRSRGQTRSCKVSGFG